MKNDASRATFARYVGKKAMKHAASAPSLSANLVFLEEDVDRGFAGKGGPEKVQWCRTEREVLIVLTFFMYVRKRRVLIEVLESLQPS